MTTEQIAIRPRLPPVSFQNDVPHHWLHDAAIPTQLVNGANLLFPAGERFFIRSVRYYLDRVDPELRRTAKGFFGQEGWHAHAHEQFFEVLEAQGYKVKRFLKLYTAIAYGFMERISPPALRLSVTVALEHYTAIMAENALREGILNYAHPTMRQLLLWHAAEEIEHKSVAFDVLKAVNPSYALRILGFIVATLCLGGFWIIGTAMLLLQDVLQGRRLSYPERARQYSVVRMVFFRGIGEYLRRDFHPSQTDNAQLAQEYLARAGLA